MQASRLRRFPFGAVTFTDFLIAAINLEFYDQFTGGNAFIHINMPLKRVYEFAAVNKLLSENTFLEFLT